MPCRDVGLDRGCQLRITLALFHGACDRHDRPKLPWRRDLRPHDHKGQSLCSATMSNTEAVLVYLRLACKSRCGHVHHVWFTCVCKQSLSVMIKPDKNPAEQT